MQKGQYGILRPKIEEIGRFEAGPIPGGGVWVSLGGKKCELTIDQARQAAAAMLRFTGCNVHFEPAGPVPNLIQDRQW